MSGVYRVEHDHEIPDWWQCTWRRVDSSHVLVLVARGDLDHVLNQLAADANTRNST